MRRGNVPKSERTLGAEVDLRVPLHEAWHKSTQSALAGLERVGAPHDPRLDLFVEVKGVGRIHRHFGVLRRQTCHPDLLGLVQVALGAPVNQRLLSVTGHLPVNRVGAQRLALAMPRYGAHVPWTFQAMNLDLALRLGEVDALSSWGFRIFYSQHVTVHARTIVNRGGVALGSIVPMPVSEEAEETWHEPIGSTLLDPASALIVEANALVSA